MTDLFSPFVQRSLTLRNRLVMSPMCQYSAQDGIPGPWHMVHLGSRAVGGVAAVIAEATAVNPIGRISAFDTGLWNDAQVQAWMPITAFIAQHGAIAGVQLGHAGRKASVLPPWQGGGAVAIDAGGWTPVAPSALPFDAQSPSPDALDAAGIADVIADFVAAAQRAQAAGFQIIELHAAHGYLLHQFLSPLSNQRNDRYGGSFDNRIRLLLEVTDAVRAVWPEALPLWVRLSATDWADAGWDLEQSVALSALLARHGVDLVDVSSGGLVPGVRIPLQPGYQVPFAQRIRVDTGIATAAVGLISAADQAQAIIADGSADLVMLGRQLLRDPYFAVHSAHALGISVPLPEQYQRAY